MNKEFIKKMVKAEILRYEAIKEVLPEGLKIRVNELEKDMAGLMKELALDFMSDSMGMDCKKTEQGKSAKKVEVDFQ